MALTFPLSTAEFADKLGVESVKWKFQDNRELSGMGSGQTLEADLAPALVTGEVSLYQRYHADLAPIEAMVEALISRMGTFFLFDPRRKGPISDPGGAIIGAAAVQINSLPNAYSMSLKGLPAGYKLTAGDYLSFDYGSNPTRRAFHRILETVTANGSGVTPVFEVAWFIRPGAAVNAAVALFKPTIKAKIMPGTWSPQSTGAMTSAASFSVVQKL